jgi:hypothetical protein
MTARPASAGGDGGTDEGYDNEYSCDQRSPHLALHQWRLLAPWDRSSILDFSTAASGLSASAVCLTHACCLSFNRLMHPFLFAFGQRERPTEARSSARALLLLEGFKGAAFCSRTTSRRIGPPTVSHQARTFHFMIFVDI